jgi:aminoglycoside N3'-acetyltransferase
VNDSRPAALAGVLEKLGVPRQRLLYVQSSVDWIQRAGFGAADVVSTLSEWTGKTGTLVMPSYPFHSTHLDYLESGAPFDVLRTPAAIGLLPEMFRRTKGVVRSLDPDFCVSALGPDADAIVGTAPAGPDPFGEDSSYQRMLDRHAIVVGLGVSLNTSSFIHLIDSRAEAGYPSPVYLVRPFSVTVVDASNRARQVPRKALRPEFQELTTPSTIVTAMRPDSEAFATLEIDGARFFKWDLDRWSDWCLLHARQRAAAGEWPCWLGRLGGQTT